ncbi:MAG TPA: 1-acyl-sn-glycerol-3-phosphate acyltransferase [Methylococcaceae bacterium]|nr:1-acyl-sn-glycerol-3-phosphate acyltransferase [Methylococcaceae bacterium]HIA46362.1 1-acyl-sn-glycerol-3-phosphate acyltransferase [Methylococcaceae bacterium]HIB62627.1 1-acyl-sn-glycerol-3-phosphate acyltransferase [Methylococcaceae bacterium]HIN69342.1 1-acyl-sn-glycerol-3-phosphate acyltransferase [Methylococcales bacterium]HIO12964.1 1-acyl-sn-glycerol-3-phosphate acyltransferase [Methylococcales bacterium]
MTAPNSSFQGNIPLLYIRSTVLFLCVLCLTLSMGIIILTLAPFPFRIRYKLAHFWATTVLWLTKLICQLDYTIEGLENISENQNAIILCKHQSAWETIALYAIFPPQVTVLKRELLWLPIWGWAAATLKPIALNRNNQLSALKKLIRDGKTRLNEGLWILIFPEGTRTKPGEPTKFNLGGCLLAEKSQHPIIPVAHNAGEFWPRYSFLKYPGTITVRIGPLIPSEGRKAVELNYEAEAWVEAAMKDIHLTNNP